MPVDKDALFYELAYEKDKGRVYGLGSFARSTHRTGVSSSQSSEVLRLTEEVTLLREAQRRSEDTMSHLLAFLRQQHPGANFGDPGASTSQASPPDATQAPTRDATDLDDGQIEGSSPDDRSDLD